MRYFENISISFYQFIVKTETRWNSPVTKAYVEISSLYSSLRLKHYYSICVIETAMIFVKD